MRQSALGQDCLSGSDLHDRRPHGVPVTPLDTDAIFPLSHLPLRSSEGLGAGCEVHLPGCPVSCPRLGRHP